jgi:hypothetical protein
MRKLLLIDDEEGVRNIFPDEPARRQKTVFTVAEMSL